jgi:chorismate mutase
MKVSEKIGEYKKSNNISVLQPARWNEIMEKAVVQAKIHGLSDGFVASVLQAIHQESINHQVAVMNDKNEPA